MSNSTNPKPCSGNGLCVSFDNCSCFGGYEGLDCSVNSNSISLTVENAPYYISSRNRTIEIEGHVINVNTSEILNETIVFNIHCLNCTDESSTVFKVVHNKGLKTFDFSLFNITTAGRYLLIMNASLFDNNSPYRYWKQRTVNFFVTYIGDTELVMHGLPHALVTNIQQSFQVVISAVKFPQRSEEIPNSYLGTSTLMNNASNLVSFSIELKDTSSSNNTLCWTSGKTYASGTLVEGGSFTTSVLSPVVSLQCNFLHTVTSASRVSLNVVLTNDKNPTDAVQFSYEIPMLSFNFPLVRNSTIISPKHGVALDTLFSVSLIDVTILHSVPASLFPLEFAFGFVLEDSKQKIRLTPFSQHYNNVNFALPFTFYQKPALKEQLDILLFIRDVFSNEYSQTIGQVEIYPNTNADSLTEKVKLNKNLALAATYDRSLLASQQSSNTSIDMTLSAVQQLTLTALDKDYSQSLQALSLLSEQSFVEQLIASALTEKVGQFLSEMKQLYIREKRQFGFVQKTVDTDLQSSLELTSNIMKRGLSMNEIAELCQKISTIAQIRENPTLLHSNSSSVPTVRHLFSEQVNITVMSFVQDVSLQNYSKNAFLQDVEFNTRYILSKYDGFSQEMGIKKVSFTKSVKTHKEDTNQLISSVKDFSFSKNIQELALQDLEEPLILSFNIQNQSLDLGSNISKLSCRYWNETTQSWNTNGCEVLRVVNETREVLCSCNHTTMFSVFMQYDNSSLQGEPNRQQFLSTLFIGQVTVGVFYFLASVIILICLFLFRTKQPIKSRLFTPFVGMVSLMIQSILISMTQKGVLLSLTQENFTQSSVTHWEGSLQSANILGNVAMIISNTLSITAIVFYLVQVLRFQFLKYFYHKMMMNNHVKNGEKSNTNDITTPQQFGQLPPIQKMIKQVASKSLSTTVLVICLLLNLGYWTLFVILVRSEAISPTAYTFVVSISYTAFVLLCGLLITGVAASDFIYSFILSMIQRHGPEQQPATHLSNVGNSKSVVAPPEKISGTSKKVVQWLHVKPLRDWFADLDAPLYFRGEMILFMLCYTFLICNQLTGLYTLMNKDAPSQQAVMTFDVISFVFEILYVATYILVFGGFSLLILAFNTLKPILSRRTKKQGSVTDNQTQDETELQTLLNSKEGRELMEEFCEKEFSLENMFMYKDLTQFKTDCKSNSISSIHSFMNNIHSNYIASGSPKEVNISSACRKEVLKVFKDIQNTSSQELKEVKNIQHTHPQDMTAFEQCINHLTEEILLNLGDTFSRLATTPRYSQFCAVMNNKEEMMKQVNLL
ncbi:hypothetical protein C9374_005647 [Naegleria lovaniensis]|uniref:GPS domain-containing protein n=1 Tax=Naegleria lovaniensis TaxID=51637 RepID=A0AA88GPT8_NAELO|nr:uncharacterized protein C9374_005647 [Naegleria lovaniensis]KAG2381855.1 hypothetical protein C9374_005647 [Naegleria lovaniensis]